MAFFEESMLSGVNFEISKVHERLSPSLFVSLPLLLVSVFLSLSLSLYDSLFLSLSVFLSISLPLCFCLSVSLFLSLSDPTSSLLDPISKLSVVTVPGPSHLVIPVLPFKKVLTA